MPRIPRPRIRLRREARHVSLLQLLVTTRRQLLQARLANRHATALVDRLLAERKADDATIRRLLDRFNRVGQALIQFEQGDIKPRQALELIAAATRDPAPNASRANPVVVRGAFHRGGVVKP